MEMTLKAMGRGATGSLVLGAVMGVMLSACSKSDSDERSDGGADADTDSDTDSEKDTQSDGNTDSETTTACTPALRETQGPQANDEITRYRFVGGSADGRKVAVLFSHFGPSSGSPFANLFGYEEGNASPLFHHLAWTTDPGTEELLRQMEDQTLADGAADMKAHGIVLGENLPERQAFCQDDASVRIAPDLTFTWQIGPKPCPSGVTDPIAQWELCFSEGGDCVQPVVVPESDCVEDGTLSLVDVFLAADTWWIVGERVTHPLAVLTFVMRSVGGLRHAP